MITQESLSTLCCPETRQAFTLAEKTLIEVLNRKIEGRELKNRKGEAVVQKIAGGLVRADKQYLYVIRQNIPILLIDEAIPLAGLL